MLVEFDHPVAGHVRTTGSPIRIDGGPARTPTLPPTLGQHTRGILDELGLDPNTVEKMIAEGTAVAS
jgi:crotonobetainyl-CoA:carnitine CoA-transferase CaiB-like acyl-CoA transferase